jgi:hypothetical protein
MTKKNASGVVYCDGMPIIEAEITRRIYIVYVNGVDGPNLWKFGP